jgi:hypothetical protein
MFVHEDGYVIFERSPVRPAENVTVLQAGSMSTGGARVGFACYGVDDILPIELKGVSTAELAALRTFHLSICRGQAETFLFTNARGMRATVRFNSNLGPIVERGYGRYNVSLSLKVLSTWSRVLTTGPDDLTTGGEALTT